MSGQLSGKYAVVTGGSRGIGAATAIDFAKRGVKGVAITYVGNKPAAEKVLAEIQSHGAIAVAIQADILSENVGETVIQGALKGLGTDHLDIIVNNAAVVDTRFSGEAFMDTTVDGFGRMFQGNVCAPMFIIRAAFPYLPARGGRIVNISSIASKMANADPFMVYGASKAALDSITRSLAQQFAAEKHCTINSVAVGPTETDAMNEAVKLMPDEFVQMIKNSATAEKRFGEPNEVANIVSFLASEQSRWVNGAYMSANGGSMIPVQG